MNARREQVERRNYSILPATARRAEARSGGLVHSLVILGAAGVAYVASGCELGALMGPVMEANSRNALKKGEVRKAEAWYTASRYADNAYSKEVAMKAAKAGKTEVHVHQGNKPAPAAPRRSPYGTFACNYWEDINGDGFSEINEFIGKKRKFKSNERITLCLAVNHKLTGQHRVQYTIFSKGKEVMRNTSVVEGCNTEEGETLKVKFAPNWFKGGRYSVLYHLDGRRVAAGGFEVEESIPAKREDKTRNPVEPKKDNLQSKGNPVEPDRKEKLGEPKKETRAERKYVEPKIPKNPEVAAKENDKAEASSGRGTGFLYCSLGAFLAFVGIMWAKRKTWFPA